MDLLQAIVLGVIQGITEFLPISSSGHLIFVPTLFGWQDQGLAFDVIVHLGSLVAVIVYFREKLWRIVSSTWMRGTVARFHRILGMILLLTIIPAGLIGYVAGDWLEASFRSAQVVAYSLIGWGVVLFLADKYNRRLEKRGTHLADVDHMNWRQIVTVSLAQAVALIPGTSRSGITMTAGLFSKLDRKAAAEFSFLMSVPVITLAGLFKLIEYIQTGSEAISFVALSTGFIAAAVSGFFAIWGLMKIVEKWSFAPFAVYRVVVGIFILVFLA